MFKKLNKVEIPPCYRCLDCDLQFNVFPEAAQHTIEVLHRVVDHCDVHGEIT